MIHCLFFFLFLGCSPFQSMLVSTPEYSENFRPQFHYTPPNNWMNDPNGLVFYNATYHLFFQYNPYENVWGHMSWGHAISQDLLHWKTLDPALLEEDGVMIFSGSATLDQKNVSGLIQNTSKAPILLFYTGYGNNKQDQNVAFSLDDGKTYQKYSKNPILDFNLVDFRDPKIIKIADEKWIMMTAMSDIRKIYYWQSNNLLQWSKVGEFGPLGSISGVYECPDLFRLKVINQRNTYKWVQIVSINPGAPQGGSASQYFIGDFNGTHFIADKTHDYNAEPLWVDYGFDFYAVVTFENDPLYAENELFKTGVGWVSNWKYAGTLPTNPWRGMQSFPREFFLKQTQEQIKLFSRPARKPLQKLILKSHLFAMTSNSSAINQEIKNSIEQGKLLLIKALFSIEKNEGSFGIKVRKSELEETVVGFDIANKTFTVDRRNSGLTNFTDNFSGYNQLKMTTQTDLRIDILLDNSVIEVFVNEGEAAFSNLIFPVSEKSQNVEIFGLDHEFLKLLGMEIHELQKTME